MAREAKDPANERQDLLERIWIAEARALVAILEGTPAKDLQAATLNVARQFLASQGTRLETLERDQRRGKAARSYTEQIAAAVKADEQEPLPEPEG